MNVRSMIESHPQSMPLDRDALVECIEAAVNCLQVCQTCADACLAEDGVQDLRHCIRTDLDCADICAATASVLSRQTAPAWDLLKAQIGSCYRACGEGAKECRKHADRHEHCRICADACRRCEEACAALLKAVEEMSVAA